MSEVTQILSQMDGKDPRTSEQLLGLVYDELRRLAAKKLAGEKPGQTLQPTALVHEAYMRLVHGDADADRDPVQWENRGHFFAAAAEAMRRILINRARDKNRLKRGGGRRRVQIENLSSIEDASDADLLDLNEALEILAAEDAVCADLVKLRFFVGLKQGEAAEALQLSRRTADRHWAYARARLYEILKHDE